MREPSVDETNPPPRDCGGTISIYETLPTPTSVRLLQILPTQGSQINCSMVVVDLDGKPVYDALSYTWDDSIVVKGEDYGQAYLDEIKKAVEALVGEEDQSKRPFLDWDTFYYFGTEGSLRLYEEINPTSERDHPIQCNGHTIMVTKNLHEALSFFNGVIANGRTAYWESILHRSISRYIWVDMICINQTDTKEVNSQVTMMHRIFSDAQTVFGWLGPADVFSKRAIEALPRLFSIAKNLSRQDMKVAQSVWSHISDISQVEWLAIFAFFQRLWFRRAWIIQEAIFAENLVMQCGSVTVPWPALEGLICLLHEIGIWDSVIDMVRTVMFGGLDNKIMNKLSRQGATIYGFRAPIQRGKSRFLLDPQGTYAFASSIQNMLACLGKPIYRSLRQHIVSTDAECHREIIEEGGEPYEDSSTGLIKFFPPRTTAILMPCMPLETDLDVQPPSLLGVLSTFRHSGASDPRDKIFAFLNVATKVNPQLLRAEELPVDYALSVRDIYTKTAKFIIENDEGLEILSHVAGNGASRILNLPSWVPDFSQGLERELVPKDPRLMDFLSSISLQLQKPLHVFNGDELEVDAIFVDTITAVELPKGCRFNRVAEVALQTPDWYRNLRSRLGMIRVNGNGYDWNFAFPVKGEHAYNYGPQSRAEALWRTMVMNEYEGKIPASIACGFGFSEWVSDHLVTAQNIVRHVTTKDLIRFVPRPVQNTTEVGSNTEANNTATVTAAAMSTSSSSSYANTNNVDVTASPVHPPAPSPAPASQQPHPSISWCDTKFQKWRALIKSEKTTFFPQDTLQGIASRYFEASPDYQRMCADNGEEDFSIDLETIGGLRYLPDSQDLVDVADSLGPKPGETTVNALSHFGKLDHEKSKDQAGFESRMRRVQIGGGDGGSVGERTGGMRLFCTAEKKLLGNGPCGIEVGDQIWMIRGMRVAVVLRPQKGDSSTSSWDITSDTEENHSAPSCSGQGIEKEEMVLKFRLIDETYLHEIARVLWAMSANEGLRFRKIRLT